MQLNLVKGKGEERVQVANSIFRGMYCKHNFSPINRSKC